MAKKPNALGRIEADPKEPRNFHLKEIGLFLLAIALLVSGIVATLKYQEFISNTKEQGAAEYRLNDCEKFETINKEKVKVNWLECDTE